MRQPAHRQSDSLHTDILGAQAAGVASALVARYGFFAGQDVDSAIERSAPSMAAIIAG